MKIKELEKLEYLELLKEISLLNYENRLLLLENQSIKEKIFLVDKKENINLFLNSLNTYKSKDLLQALDKDILRKLETIYQIDAYYILVSLKQKDSEIFQEMLKENKDLVFFLLKLPKNSFYDFYFDFSLETLFYFIEFMEKNNIDVRKTSFSSMISFSKINETEQKNFLETSIPNVYKEIAMKYFDGKIIADYIKNHSIFLSNDTIYRFLLRGIDLDISLYENTSFFKEIILSKTIPITRRKIVELSNYIDSSYMEKELKKMEENIIMFLEGNHIEDNSIAKVFLDKTNINSSRKQLLLTSLFDYFFEDSIRNVCLDIEEVLSYSKKNNKVLSREQFKFYQQVINLLEADISDILKFYKTYKNTFRPEMFYEDINASKMASYQKIKEECIKIKEIENLKNQELSKTYGVDIYDFQGEPFRMLVTCRNRIPEGNNSSPRNCYSLIGHENMRVFREDRYIFGFENFDIRNIMHVYEADSYSEDNPWITTKLVNRIRTSDEIIRTNHRSEIQILNPKIPDSSEYQRLLPSYLICFDTISPSSLEAAKILNIPIFILHRNRYFVRKEKNNLENYQEEYFNGLNDENNYQGRIK